MRKVLLDQGLAPRAAKLLRAEGWEALHIGEAGLDRADDSDILEFAKAVWEACGEAIEEGAAVSTDGMAVRFRRLPLR